MEDKKLFNVRDNFFIAEALDALGLGLPVPPHTQKEFDEQPDAFIIWQKLFALTAVIPSPSSPKFFSVKISLTPAQVQTLSSIPVLAVPAPGVGKMIEVVSASCRLNFVSVAYTSQYVFFGENPPPDIYGSFNLLLTPANIIVPYSFAVSGNFAQLENADLTLRADSDSLVGDSPVDVYIVYRIVTL